MKIAVVIMRAILAAGLVYMIYHEAGPFTAIFAALTLLALEGNAFVRKRHDAEIEAPIKRL